MTGTVFSYLFPGDWNYTWEFLGKEKLSEFCGVQKQCVMDGTRSGPIFFLLYDFFSWLLVTSATSNIKLGKLDLHFSLLLFSFET